MEVIIFIIAVIFCILCYSLSSSFNESMKSKYRRGCINWVWSVVTAVLLTAALLTIGETLFWVFLPLTLLSAGVSAWLTYAEMTAWGASSRESALGAAAQAASAVGIAAAIVFVMLMLFGGKKKRRR